LILFHVVEEKRLRSAQSSQWLGSELLRKLLKYGILSSAHRKRISRPKGHLPPANVGSLVPDVNNV
jgi:hypothetical protein